MKILSSEEKEWEAIKKEMEKDSNGNPSVKGDSDDTTFRSSMDVWSEEYPDLMMLEPREIYDEAIVGVVERINLTAFCYDTQEILNILAKPEYMMTPEEALEHFEYNIKGSYVGEHSPVFLDRKVDL